MTTKPAHVVGAVSGWERGKPYFDAHCTCGWIVTPATFEECFVAQAAHLHAHGLMTREERLAARDKVYVFSNGTEHMAWEEQNCFRCTKGYETAPEGWKCDIQKAIGEAMFDEDAAMDREMAVRGGLASSEGADCPEREIDYAGGMDA